MSNLVSVERASHWYSKDGKPVYEVPLKSDPTRTRRTDLRDARKLNLLPSVTTVIRIIEKPFLSSWKIEQAILASLTLPRGDGESDDDFALRIVKDAESIVEKAAERGTLTHDAIERFLTAGVIQPDARVEHIFQHFPQWAKENLGEVTLCEKILTGGGYAGKLDLIANYNGRQSVIDFKTRSFRNGKVASYDDDIWQGGGYYQLAWLNDIKPEGFVSVYLDAEGSGIIAKEWTHEELQRGVCNFNSILETWREIKQYHP